MQLAFHNEILNHVEVETIPQAEPVVSMIAWKIAAVMIILKFIGYLWFMNRTGKAHAL